MNKIFPFALASGTVVDVNNFDSSLLTLEDIAHHLAKIQRYNGSIPINTTYSVGEHCINLASYFLRCGGTEDQARIALLHDVSEAVLNDIPTFVKALLPDYKKLEDTIEMAMFNKYLPNIDKNDFQIVKLADKRLFIDEVEAIMPNKLTIYTKYSKYRKLGIDLIFNHRPSMVRDIYLNLCKELGIFEYSNKKKEKSPENYEEIWEVI